MSLIKIDPEPAEKWASLIANLLQIGAALVTGGGILFWALTGGQSPSGPWWAVTSVPSPTTAGPADPEKRDPVVPEKGVAPGKPPVSAAALGIKMVPLAPGTFRTTRLKNERHPEQGRETLRLVVARAFSLSECEITQEQYLKVMGHNPSHFAPTGEGRESVKGLDTGRFPVENLTHQEAVAFCRKLSELPEEKAAGRVYRLPTEVEWEYACRAGGAQPFCVGRRLTSRHANCDDDEALKRPCPVRSYAANAFGLYDMHGNVREYCANGADVALDRIHGAEGQFIPDENKARAVRGGSFTLPPPRCRCEFRDAEPAGRRLIDVGFRVACVPGEAR